jgi:hypothetical protein
LEGEIRMARKREGSKTQRPGRGKKSNIKLGLGI